MAHIALIHGIWVLVCDGRKALLLQNQGDDVYPKLETREVLEHEDRPTHTMGSDAPGRTFGSAGGRRAAVESTDMQDEAEAKFLKSVAGKVNSGAEDGFIKHLIVVAPARALSVLRHAFSKRAKSALKAEVDKDLVRMPVFEIEKHLKADLSR